MNMNDYMIDGLEYERLLDEDFHSAVLSLKNLKNKIDYIINEYDNNPLGYKCLSKCGLERIVYNKITLCSLEYSRSFELVRRIINDAVIQCKKALEQEDNDDV